MWVAPDGGLKQGGAWVAIGMELIGLDLSAEEEVGLDAHAKATLFAARLVRVRSGSDAGTDAEAAPGGQSRRAAPSSWIAFGMELYNLALSPEEEARLDLQSKAALAAAGKLLALGVLSPTEDEAAPGGHGRRVGAWVGLGMELDGLGLSVEEEVSLDGQSKAAIAAARLVRLRDGAAIEVSGVGTKIPFQRWDVSSSPGHLSEAQNDSVRHGGFDGPDHGDTKVFTGTSSIRLRGGGYFIRRASLEDIPYLAALDTSLWPALLSGLTEDEIRALIQTFEAGQLVLCASSGDLVGSLYTQRVASDDALLFDTATFRDALALHQDSGSVWQLLSVQVTPILMSRGLGDVLINYALTVARASPGVHKVVAVTRCRTWAQKVRQQPTLEEHLEMGTGPGLVFHTARGALVPNKRPEHLANGGVSFLIEYDLASFRIVHGKPPLAIKQGPTRLAGSPTACANRHSGTRESAHEMQRVVRSVVHSFLKEDVSVDTPLMGAGIDSYMMQNFVQASAAEGWSML